MNSPESNTSASEPNLEQSFDIAPPPRAVPFTLRCRLRFGGILNLTAWGIVAIGLIISHVFLLDCELLNHVTFSGDKYFVTGYVTFTDETNASENNERIYKVNYRYAVAGTEYQGYSFELSSHLDSGEEVIVEYLRDAPSVSRIEGMRRYRFPSWAGIVGIFPLIGLGLVAFGLRRGQHDLRILRSGLPAQGRIVEKKATSVRVNEARVYKFVFAYQDRNGKTHKAAVTTIKTGQVEDEATERLLYDPTSPNSIVVMDILPRGVHIDPMGQLRAPESGVYYRLIPIVVAAIAIGIGLLAVI
jgi:hypothetical protein